MCRDCERVAEDVPRDQEGGLLVMGVKRARYDYETKVAAARAMVDGGMSKPEAMVRFGIASATPLKQWCRLSRSGRSSRPQASTCQRRHGCLSS